MHSSRYTSIQKTKISTTKYMGKVQLSKVKTIKDMSP
jgi:hypothetical protein